jgi:hypothetical protein
MKPGQDQKDGKNILRTKNKWCTFSAQWGLAGRTWQIRKFSGLCSAKNLVLWSPES